jgi:hypothetical protein
MIPKNLSISLCDLTGRSCGEILPNDMAEGSMRYKINVHELASGIYFVKIKDQERKDHYLANFKYMMPLQLTVIQ